MHLAVMSEDDKRSDEDRWQDQSLAAVHQFGRSLKALHQANPWPDLPLLPRAMNHLMTELWDQGFSQTEIREAFEEAVADMPRYAAGEERRS
jgi:hypothetical protein